MSYDHLLEAIRGGADLAADVVALQAEAALVAADWLGATRHAEAVLERPASIRARCCSLRVLALARARQGDRDVWPLLDEARTLAEAAGETPVVAAARAEVAWLSGQSDEMPDVDGVGRYAALLASAADDLRGTFYALRAMGAHGAAEAVGRELQRRGVRGLPRGPYGEARTNPAGLTPRELEVARLLAEGLRNRDISDRLILSLKTVDHHVSAILRKLNVPTRTAAAHSLRLAA